MLTPAAARRLHDEIRADIEEQGLNAFERTAVAEDAIADALQELQRFNDVQFAAAHIRDVPFTHAFWEEWLDAKQRQQRQEQQQQTQQQHRQTFNATTVSEPRSTLGKQRSTKTIDRWTRCNGIDGDMSSYGNSPAGVEAEWKRVHGSLSTHTRHSLTTTANGNRTRAAKFSNSQRFPVDKSKWDYNACMYTTEELDSRVKPHHGSCTFSTVKRITMPLGEQSLQRSTLAAQHQLETVNSKNSTMQKGVGFARAQRFAVKMGEEENAPSPNNYHVPSLFGTAQMDRLQKVRVPPPPPKLGSVGTFGYGCDPQQHALYGGCLDGKCMQRASWERIESRDAYAGVGDEGSSCDTRKSTSTLHVACAKADLAVIDSLCLRGADVNAVDAQDRTVLHVAVQSGNLAAVQRLLDNSEHAFVKRNGYREIRQNPNVNAQDNMGYTPLHLAAMSGDANIATALCDAGADANITAHDGTTPANVSDTQPVFQVIRGRVEQQALETRLQELASRKQQLQIAAIRAKLTTATATTTATTATDSSTMGT